MKPVVLIFWTVLWLAGAMHCPLEAMGLFAADHCCFVSATASENANGSPRSTCSYEEKARLSNPRVETIASVPNPSTAGHTSFLCQPYAAPVVEPTWRAESPLGLSQTWCFRWRTALAPRAPTPRA